MDIESIVTKVAEKSGIGADTVRTVLTTAIDHIKGQLPPQFASQIDMFVKGGGGDGGPGSAAGMPGSNPLAGLGGLFGGK